MTTNGSIKKNDFIEIEFTGTSNNEIFDTTNPEEAKQMGLESIEDIKPLIVSVGNEMLLKGFDEALENKEINKKYKIHLTPEKAFGKRNPSLIRTYNIKVFRDKDINPIPGMALQLDNTIAKVISVSGGRVMVDFNNPLAGKDIDYSFIIKGKITDDKKKINALQDFFFKKIFDFEIKDKKVIFYDKEINSLVEIMKDKFKQMTGFEFEVREKKEVEEKKDKVSEETTGNATQDKSEKAQESKSSDKS